MPGRGNYIPCFIYQDGTKNRNAYGKKNGLDLADRGVKMPLKKLGLPALLAVIVVTVAYAIVFVEDYFFFADFRL